jgi:hypothetical protein
LDIREANCIFNEIAKCGKFEPKDVSLMPPDANSVLSHGYQLHVKARLGEDHIECVKPFIEKYSLAMNYEPEKELLVIYRPLK